MDQITHMLSGMSKFAAGLGSFIGPIYGACMMTTFGFRSLMVTTGTLTSAVAFITVVMDKFKTAYYQSTPVAHLANIS